MKLMATLDKTKAFLSGKIKFGLAGLISGAFLLLQDGTQEQIYSCKTEPRANSLLPDGTQEPFWSWFRRGSAVA
ncbi:hypothetical protein [Magnetococcus marinus]|uniref:hypothetical protein n=1 Tax=Magnetococcus marinus TaxID=1124597 RepID=UPI0005A2C863|nr:hypothetical protein [Magnetococcus marinus]